MRLPFYDDGSSICLQPEEVDALDRRMMKLFREIQRRRAMGGEEDMTETFMLLDEKLEVLAKEAWRQFQTHAAPLLVSPSIPILFFGDLRAYQKSKLKVVTVGLNPSNLEFPSKEPFLRFTSFAKRATSPDASEGFLSTYAVALSRYFAVEPYKGWFGRNVAEGRNAGFEPVLRGLGSSYYDGPNIALHTDICCPLATKDKWSDLDQTVRDSLCRDGTPLWNDLIEYLDPDVMLMAGGDRYRPAIRFKATSPRETLMTVGITRQFDFELGQYQLPPSGKDQLPPSGKVCSVVFGRSFSTPYGTVSATEKQDLGRRIKERIGA